MSRRSFISGATIFGLSGAALGLSACTQNNSTQTESDNSEKQAVSQNVETETAKNSVRSEGTKTNSDWLGEAPEINESEIKDTITTDLVIIGAGNGGMAAAVTAADLKLDFKIFEKNGFISPTRHWFGAIDSKYTKEAGVSVERGKLLNEISRYSSAQCNPRVVSVWINESAEMVDWLDPILTEAGMKCNFDTDTGTGMGGTDFFIAPVEHYYHGQTADGKRIARNDVFLKYIQDRGYDVEYEHALVKLEEENSKVVAAIFKTKDDYIRCKANKGILLATGGYVGNVEMLKACNPLVDQCVTLQYGSINNTGDGIKAAMWLGAAKDKIGAPMIFDRGAVKPGENAGIIPDDKGRAEFIGTDKQFNLGSQPLMKVTRDGKRYVNESTPYNDSCFAAAQHDGGVFCQIFDSNLKENVKRFNTTGCSRQTQVLLAKEADTPLDEIYKKELEKGVMFKADTLEELVEKLGFVGEYKENLLAEIEKNNTFFDNQVDEEFGKEAYRLSEIRTAPFYGVWYGGSLLTTVDGLKINENMQVLDESATIIPGLYATGDCSGCFYANNYPEYIPGNAMGRTLTFARHAVKHIAGEI